MNCAYTIPGKLVFSFSLFFDNIRKHPLMKHEIEKIEAAKKKKKKTEHKKHGHINWCGYKRKQ